ncbi:MAG: hypothetical protein H0W73_19485 [Bacteroidetes bacterium]|nr:hypothetical protein [Bacteroidota bacterium]
MKISINTPCHENWDNMTPNDQGVFCLSCQKSVVDFSTKTISQIKEFFYKKTDTASVCGRFETDQLNEISFEHFFDQFRSWKYFQKFALIAFFVFGFSLFSNGQTKPKEHVRMGKVAYTPTDTIKKCGADTSRNKIKGRVSNSNTKPKTKTKPKKQAPLVGDISFEDEKK